MKRFFLSAIYLIISQFIFAQTTFNTDGLLQPVRPEILSNLHIDSDHRLNKMLNWHIQQNELMNSIDGFRVEIFFSSDYNAFEKAKKKKVEF